MKQKTTVVEDLSRQFAPYWLEAQVLPQGYHVVNSLSGKMVTRPGRPANSSPMQPFSVWNALTKPSESADASYAEGYAELSLIVTKTVVEVYRQSAGTQQPTTSEGAGGGGGSSAAGGTAAPSVHPEELPTDIPPFFPLIRAYVNDKAVYQSKIGQLSEPLRLPVESMATEGQDWPKTPTSTAPGSPTTPLVLSSIHEVDFNEELKLGIHTPASLLTVQLFEKDFCADIALSEILLASATIPIHCLHPGRNLDLVISVHCTLPQYYSLQALMGKEELVAHEPVAMIARLYVSLTLSMPGRGWTVVLREVAALSLPRGPWTPQALVDPSLEDDELVAITGCDIFSVAKEDGTVSLLSLLDAITSLIFALTEGFDDLGSEAVVTYLKNTKADIPQEERLRMSYVAIVEDLFTLAEYLVVGPIARISKFVHEITHFKRPLTTLCLVLVVWLPFAAPQSALLYSIMVGWFSLFFVTEVGIPTRPTAEANNRFSALISKIQQIQGAEMLVRPIEQSVNVATVRRIRIVELWVKALKTRVLRDAFKERTEHFQASLMRVITHDEGITTLCTQQYGYDTNLTAHITAQCYSTVCAVPQLV